MPVIRLFTPGPLSAGARIAPSPAQTHYLVNVMRLGVGGEARLFNGRDGEWRARLEAASRRGAVLVVEALARPQDRGPDLDLLIAAVKRPRLETIVEKAAELGARRVTPLITHRTNSGQVNVARLTAIAEEASEQTGRLEVPEVAAARPLNAVLDAWPEGRRLMFCDEAGEAAPAAEVLAGEARGAWAILIGPEGGFSAEERARVRALPFTLAVSLGPRILRADTAAIAAMTLWQAALGDWRVEPRRA